MVAYFCHKIQENYHDYFQKTIAINESFLEILSRQKLKDKFRGNFDLSQLVFQNNHYCYSVCHCRNMPPFYRYEKLMQILSVTSLVKRGPGLLWEIVKD